MKTQTAEQVVISALDRVAKDMSKSQYGDLLSALVANLGFREEALKQELAEEESTDE